MTFSRAGSPPKRGAALGGWCTGTVAQICGGKGCLGRYSPDLTAGAVALGSPSGSFLDKLIMIDVAGHGNRF
jgi:hypothetical protein